MKFKRQARAAPEINLTPLIDVVFLLLIFFMVTTTFTRQTALKVDLPQAEAQPAAKQPRAIEITITAQGRFAVNGKALAENDATALKAAVSSEASDDSSRPLVISADAMTPHQAVVTAMDVAGQLGFVHLSITTRTPTSTGGE